MNKRYNRAVARAVQAAQVDTTIRLSQTKYTSAEAMAAKKDELASDRRNSFIYWVRQAVDTKNPALAAIGQLISDIRNENGLMNTINHQRDRDRALRRMAIGAGLVGALTGVGGTLAWMTLLDNADSVTTLPAAQATPPASAQAYRPVSE